MKNIFTFSIFGVLMVQYVASQNIKEGQFILSIKNSSNAPNEWNKNKNSFLDSIIKKEINPASIVLENIECKDISFDDMNLRGITIKNCKFNNVNFMRVLLNNSTILDTTFTGGDMSEVFLDSANIQKCKFNNTILNNAKVQNSNWVDVELNTNYLRDIQVACEVVNVGVNNPPLRYVINFNFSRPPLQLIKDQVSFYKKSHTPSRDPATVFQNSNYKKASEMISKINSFRNIDLSKQDLSNQDLESAGLQNANLEGTNLTNTNLIRADLTGANLTNAIIIGAKIKYTNLGIDLYTKLGGTKIDNLMIADNLFLKSSNEVDFPDLKDPSYTQETKSFLFDLKKALFKK